MVVLKSVEMEINIKNRAKTVLIAQEISFAKTLACNDKRLRDRALKKLRNWLANRIHPDQPSVFTKQDMMTLWKGLFFCMWMSDKPLIQEELAENISNLLWCLEKDSDAVYAFIEAFFITMRGDWSSIDNYRIGKFQMLVRRMLRQALLFTAKNDWELAHQMANVLWSSILSIDGGYATALGLCLHVCEIFLEELAKVTGRMGMSQLALTELLRPFVQCLASKTGESRLRGTITNTVFTGLIKQSDEGIEHQEKLEAWRRMGCPAIPLDQLERMEVPQDQDDEDETEEKPTDELDPRAGQLDVELPQIPFDPSQVAKLINEFIEAPETNTKAKRRLRNVVKRFEELAEGQYPLTFKLPLVEEDEDVFGWSQKKAVKEAAYSLRQFERKLTQEDAALGVAKQSTLKRLAMQETEEHASKKRKKRCSGQWQVTEIEEAKTPKQNGDSGSPGTQGRWEVSPIAATSSKANEWEQPLQDGEYEYFVTPRKRQPEKKKGKKSKSPEAAASTSLADTDQSKLMNGTDLVADDDTNASKTASPSPEKKKLRSSKTPSPTNRQFLTINTPEFGEQHIAIINPEDFKPCTPKPNLGTVTPGRLSYSVQGTDNLSMSVGSGKKKVEFKLARNMFQEVREYAQQLKNSPGIPHDPNKKPTQGLLKPSTPTPVHTPTSKRSRLFI